MSKFAPDSPWTDVRVAQLTQLWLADLSAQQIADVLNADPGLSRPLTRSAVLGQVERRGIKRPSPPHAPFSRVPRPGLVPRPAARAAVPRAQHAARLAFREDEYSLPSMRKPLADLAAAECRWPFGDGAPYLFCAQATDGLASYCLFHACVSAHGMTVARSLKFTPPAWRHHDGTQAEQQVRVEQQAAAHPPHEPQRAGG